LALAAPATTAAAPKAADAAGSLASLKAAQIIPDVVSDFVPTATLTVDYGKQTPVKMGEQLLPSEAAMDPKVTFTGTDPKKVREGRRRGREGGWVEGRKGGFVCWATRLTPLIDWWRAIEATPFSCSLFFSSFTPPPATNTQLVLHSYSYTPSPPSFPPLLPPSVPP